MADMTPIEVARFWSRVRVGPDFQCWEWTGRTGNDSGYGRLGRTYAHRVAYTLINGPIPDGLLVRHKCDNPPCCNPRHLIVGTIADNAKDMVERSRHSCGPKNGRAKITAEQALEILRNPDGMKLRDLAEKFGVSPSTVSLIRSGERWAHLTAKFECNVP